MPTGPAAETGFVSPLSRQNLAVETPHSLAAPGERWPVVEGIPYLRMGREALVADTLHLLDEGRDDEALALLLGDQDDWARTPPASMAERLAVVRDADRITFRGAMERLAFGGVGTYFAHRWSDPTFLSGLALAEAHWTNPARVFELACGAGHFLREFARFCPDASGGDVVFAKLWLARRFVAPGARLICFDAAAPWPLRDGVADMLFCHDAFYFLPHKPHVAREMRRVASGPVLVGHAHNALVDNLSSGDPLSPAEYAALFEQPSLYDDAVLTGALLGGTAPRAVSADSLAEAAAVSIASRAPAARAVTGGLAMPAEGARLRRNPLYHDGLIAWPSPRYQTEYGPLASYPDRAEGPAEAVAGDPALERLARRRILVDLPARW
jgi:SAM-dependent methyltransferase